MTEMQRHNSLISADMRILLHLLNCHGSISQFDVSIDITEIGIVQKVGLSYGYASRLLKGLVHNGYIQEGIGHIKGGRRKHKFYTLTNKGKKYARKIKNDLSKLVITVILSNESSKIMKLDNIIPYLGKKKIYQGVTEMDIYTLLTKDGVINIESLKQIKKKSGR
ncbi:MAG: hypothetical protein JSW00_02790 [Thermoplasmata archaeon]|nr:MAG: hypothetical protein JSW00_02790 [Thermoplasmata archaeon]